MAGEDRAASYVVTLTQALQKEPFRFDLFQALRGLECAHPDKPRIGQSLKPSDDPVRLGQEPSLAFAPSALAGFGPGRDGGPPRLSVFSFGVWGPNGPLPLHLTEYARDRMRNSDDLTLVRFLDLFHHRMLSLFYRAWAAAQPTVSFDRPDSDRFAIYIGALFGLAMPSLRNRDAFEDLAKFHHAGHLARQVRSAEDLKDILQDYFGLPVDIEQFIGQWLELSRDYLCRLGESPEVSTLGRTITLGSRTLECQHKFRLVFGPLCLADYQGLLPGEESLAPLVSIVRTFIGDELAWDVNLLLKKDEVPPYRLGGRERLGWTIWLTRGPLERDAEDLLVEPMALSHEGSGRSSSIESGVQELANV